MQSVLTMHAYPPRWSCPHNSTAKAGEARSVDATASPSHARCMERLWPSITARNEDHEVDE